MLLKINIDFAIRMCPFELEYYSGKVPISVYEDKTIFNDFDEMKFWLENKKKVLFLNINDVVLKIGLLECDYSTYYRFLYNGNVFITTEKYFNEL